VQLGNMICFRLIILLSFQMFYTLNCNSQDISSEVQDYCRESMSYRLKYGIFNIGRGTISCFTDTEGKAGQIKAEVHSTGWIKIFKDLDYRYGSHIDLDTGLPNSAFMNLKDGRNTTYYEFTFDHDSRTDSAIVFSQTSGQYVVPKNIFDILTGFYHFRNNYIDKSKMTGEDVVIKTFFTDELWDLRIRYAGDETIKTKYGQIECYKFNPTTVIGRYFKHDDDMSIWFTKDEIHIPIKIRANLKLGSMVIECVEYQKLGVNTSELTDQIVKNK